VRKKRWNGQGRYFLNVSVEDAALEVCELFACVDLAEIAEVVQPD